MIKTIVIRIAIMTVTRIEVVMIEEMMIMMKNKRFNKPTTTIVLFPLHQDFLLLLVILMNMFLMKTLQNYSLQVEKFTFIQNYFVKFLLMQVLNSNVKLQKKRLQREFIILFLESPLMAPPKLKRENLVVLC